MATTELEIGPEALAELQEQPVEPALHMAMAATEIAGPEVGPEAAVELQGPPEAKALHTAMAMIELEVEVELEAAVGVEVDRMGWALGFRTGRYTHRLGVVVPEPDWEQIEQEAEPGAVVSVHRAAELGREPVPERSEVEGGGTRKRVQGKRYSLTVDKRWDSIRLQRGVVEDVHRDDLELGGIAMGGKAVVDHILRSLVRMG